MARGCTILAGPQYPGEDPARASVPRMCFQGIVVAHDLWEKVSR